MTNVYLILISALIALLNFSQAFSQNSINHSYNRAEASAGFSYQREGDISGFENSSALLGFDAAVTRNFTRYFGVKGAVSGAYRKDNFTVPSFFPGGGLRSFNINASLYTYMGGVQIKDNSKEKKLKPFLHALAGAGTVKQTLSGQCPSDVMSVCRDYTYSKTGFSGAFGGGIDLKATRRISIRIIQADYNPIFIGGSTVNNFRIGAGIVFH